MVEDLPSMCKHLQEGGGKEKEGGGRGGGHLEKGRKRKHI
jgi:hypothetical protein